MRLAAASRRLWRVALKMSSPAIGSRPKAVAIAAA
jgi:hypothetical protein